MQTWEKQTVVQCRRTHQTCSPDLFEEEDEEPEMPEHEVPEPEDAHEEAPVPVPNRFLALRIVYGDGLRRMPSVG